jgi:hypothetical protein
MAGAKAEANTEKGDAGGGGSFSEQRLVEKLNKLNNSAASIQSILFRGFVLAHYLLKFFSVLIYPVPCMSKALDCIL